MAYCEHCDHCNAETLDGEHSAATAKANPDPLRHGNAARHFGGILELTLSPLHLAAALKEWSNWTGMGWTNYEPGRNMNTAHYRNVTGY